MTKQWVQLKSMAFDETATTVDLNTITTVKAAAKDGYRFTGWYEGSNLVSSDAEYSFRVRNNVSLTAKFELNAKL